MYFNETNDTNIDDELKPGSAKKTKKVIVEREEPTETTEKKKLKIHFSEDTALTIFYGFLLVVGIILILICLK